MASGTVFYWNGASGWIKQSGVEDQPTAQANDVFVLREDVITPDTIAEGSSVVFSIDTAQPWLSRNVVVSP